MTAASNFMLMAIQEWGQSDGKRIAAVQRILNAAGFDAVATCGPVFGGIWPTSCSGLEAAQASEWLNELTDSLRRGEFDDEVRQVEAAITKAAVQAS